MKSLNEIDLQEWELVPDEGFLEIREDGGKKTYFMCPPDSIPELAKRKWQSEVPNELVTVPVVHKRRDQELVEKEKEKEAAHLPIETNIRPSQVSEKINSFDIIAEADQDPVSQVFFRKMKEREFDDMKVDSPRSNSGKGIMPQAQIEGADVFHFEGKGEPHEKSKTDLDMVINRNNIESDLEKSHGVGLNTWKWSLTGLGAICSFGAAAACVWMIIFSSHKKTKHHQQNQKLRFQIYTNDKRIKQVVRNEAS